MDDQPQDPQKVEDMDVPEHQADEVKGGAGALRDADAAAPDSPVATYSIINAWPKKYSG